MAEAWVQPLALLEAVIAAAVTLVARRTGGSVGETARIAAGIGLLTSSTWNLANAATFTTWPASMMAFDVAWHVGLGAVAGAVAALAWRWLVARPAPAVA